MQSSPAAIEEQTVLQGLINSNEFLRKSIPYIKPEYFQSNANKIIFEKLKEYLDKYNSVPIKKAILIELANSTEQYPLLKNESFVNETVESLKVLYSSQSKETIRETKLEWLLDITEKWCQDRAIYNAILESVSIIDNNDKEQRTTHAIPKILEGALSVSFDQSIGHDYIDSSVERWDFYHKKEERIPFNLEMFNKITRGGIPNKTLNILLSGPGGGKSLAKCHLAASYLMESKNVLYITMEMAEEKIAERIDANLMDCAIKDLADLSMELFQSKIQQLKGKTQGRLFIKEFPTGAASVQHFRILLNELKQKKTFEPDIIFIDYLNICASARFKTLAGSSGTYSYVKSIAEELRGLAIELNCPIWTSVQANRSGVNNSDMDMTNVSESMGVAATADCLFALISTDELAQRGQLMIKQLKNRYADPSYYSKFFIGVDRAKMKLYDLEDSAQPQQLAQAPPPNLLQPSSESLLNNFSDFKV